MWSLESIVQGVGGCAARVEKTTFSGISTDSRTIGPGEFFIPLKGPNFDGHAFIDAAYERSGGGCLCDRTRQEAFARSRGTVILVDDSNKALLDLASYKRGQISAAFVAITGSNGKTTTKETPRQSLERPRPGRLQRKKLQQLGRRGQNDAGRRGKPGLLHLRAGHEP